jgi:hypothetical protein
MVSLAKTTSKLPATASAVSRSTSASRSAETGTPVSSGASSASASRSLITRSKTSRSCGVASLARVSPVTPVRRATRSSSPVAVSHRTEQPLPATASRATATTLTGMAIPASSGFTASTEVARCAIAPFVRGFSMVTPPAPAGPVARPAVLTWPTLSRLSRAAGPGTGAPWWCG